MNQIQLAGKIREVLNGAEYTGVLTPYAVQSIELGRSNYPVQNLISYCQDSNIQLVMKDMATEDSFFPESVLDVHQTLNLLMRRYMIDPKIVFQKTRLHYTPPKSLEHDELEKIQKFNKGKVYTTPLSVKTLLAVCDVIHCELSFITK